MASEKHAEQLRALRAAFAGNLNARIAEIEAAAEALKTARDKSAWRQSAKSLAALSHKLRGSAGTFGYGGVSESAGRLERLACDLLKHKDQPDREIIARIDKLVTGIATAGKDEPQTNLESRPAIQRAGKKPAVDGEDATRILLVDDDEAQAEVLETILSNFRF